MHLCNEVLRVFIAFKQLIYRKSAELEGSLHLKIKTCEIAGAGTYSSFEKQDKQNLSEVSKVMC